MTDREKQIQEILERKINKLEAQLAVAVEALQSVINHTIGPVRARCEKALAKIQEMK